MSELWAIFLLLLTICVTWQNIGGKNSKLERQNFTVVFSSALHPLPTSSVQIKSAIESKPLRTCFYAIFVIVQSVQLP